MRRSITVPRCTRRGVRLSVSSLTNLPNKRRDRIVRRFRLIVEDEHARTWNLHELKLRVFRDERFP